MISKKDILKMVRKVARSTRGKKERRSMNPRREWFVGLGIFSLIVIIGGIANARNYMYYDTLELRVQETTGPIMKYHEANADGALEKYTAKRTAFSTLIDDVVETPAAPTSTPEVSDEAEISPEVSPEDVEEDGAVEEEDATSTLL